MDGYSMYWLSEQSCGCMRLLSCMLYPISRTWAMRKRRQLAWLSHARMRGKCKSVTKFFYHVSTAICHVIIRLALAACK